MKELNFMPSDVSHLQFRNVFTGKYKGKWKPLICSLIRDVVISMVRQQNGYVCD